MSCGPGCQKLVFAGRKTLEVGIFDPFVTFNDRNIGRLVVLKELVDFTDYHKNTVEALKKVDQEWLRKAELSTKEMTKEISVNSNRRRLEYEDDGDIHYSLGVFQCMSILINSYKNIFYLVFIYFPKILIFETKVHLFHEPIKILYYNFYCVLG